MPKAADVEPRVLFLPSKGLDACVLYRVWFVVRALRKAGHVAEWSYFERFNERVRPVLDSGRFNVVVTPRFGLKERWMNDVWINLMRSHEAVWCYEADDDIFTDRVLPRQAEFFRAAYPHAHAAGIDFQIEWERTERNRLLEHVDAVTVSTPPLADLVRQFTDAPVTVVPNAIDVEWFQQRMNRKPRWIPPVTVGWAGGWRGYEDIEQAITAWSRIAKRYPQVRFVIYGFTPDLVKMLIPVNRLEIIPWGPLARYPAGLRNIDIMCCSVSSDPWNLNKSPIKWFEATAAGAACVVSRALYGSYVSDGNSALVAETADEWEEAIASLIEHPERRRVLRVQASATVGWRHTLNTTLPQWLNAWSAMLTAKAHDGRVAAHPA